MASISAALQPLTLQSDFTRTSLRQGKQSQVALSQCRRSGQQSQLTCRATLTGVPADQALDTISSTSVDQEWVKLGLSYLNEDGGSKLDEEWLRLGLAMPTSDSYASLAADASHVQTLEVVNSHLDRVWLDLGLSLSDMEPALALQEAPILAQEPEGVLAAVEQPATVAVDPSIYFASDLRPIVLFDGACSFCSRWVHFQLDHDPHGNLRFASMQGEAGQALLKKAGLRETDTSEIVIATHKRSYIGAEAILHIFSRLNLPFPLIAAIGFMTPGPVTHSVYKLVSKYRHKFGGPSACRLFDPRFNERFLA